MTSKEVAIQLQDFCGGSSFCTCRQVTKFLGQTNDNRVKQRYLHGLPRLSGTKSYFISDVAKRLYNETVYADNEG